MIREALAAGGVPSTVSNNILAGMWGKFCAFCCNAAVSTLTCAAAGEIAASAAGAAFVSSVFDECARITSAEGYPPPAEYRKIIIGMYAQAGSAYRPSIAVDLAERRRTEPEYTIGDLVRRADRLGMDVPILRAALCNLQIAEARTRRSAA